jgi:maltooligosyltrehalose synthase
MNRILKSKRWIQDRSTAKLAILELKKDWQPLLGLGHWQIKTTFWREANVATCWADPKYFKAELNFYILNIFDEITCDFDVEELVVHELCHCVTWSLNSMTDRLIQHVGDDSGELEQTRETWDEQMVTTMGRSLVMAKYRLTSLPNAMLDRKWNDKVDIRRRV